MTITERLESALHSAKPVQALRALIQNLADEGNTKNEIYGLFEKFLIELRKRPSVREADEDVLLDVMDALTGWCHSSAELLPEMPVR